MSDSRKKIEEEKEEQSVDIGLFLYDMFRGLRKYWYVGLILVLVLGIVGAKRQIDAYSPMYRCKATFTVNTQQSANADYSYTFYYDQSAAKQMVATFPYILNSDLLKDRILEDLGLGTLPGYLDPESVAQSNLFTLYSYSWTPENAYNLLQAAVANYPAVAEYIIGNTELYMIEPPRMPTEPYNQLEWVSSCVKYAVLGLILFAGLLALYALTRNTIRREDEMEKKLQLSSLGVVPLVVFKKRSGKVNKTISIRNDKTGFAFQESFRGMGLRVASQLQEYDAQVVGVTAAAEGEGATTAARNMALAMAEAGKRVIYIDAHFLRKRTRSKSGKGLEMFLAGECQLADVLVKDKQDSLWTASCSRSITTQELAQYEDRLKALVESAKNAVDYVILDIPACSQMSHAAPGIELCDALVLVVRQDNLKRSRLMDAVEDLTRFEARLLGGVLNGAQGGLGGYGYSYGYSYGKYGYGKGSYGRYGRGYASGYAKAYGYGYGYGSSKKK